MYTKDNQSWKVGLILGLTLSLMAVPVLGDGENPEPEGPDSSAILSKAADNLGIEESKLTEAFRQAFLEVATNEIDERVKEGWLGEKKAELIKEELQERVGEGELPMMFGGETTGPFGFFGGVMGPRGHQGGKMTPGMRSGRGPGFGHHNKADE